MTFRWYCKQEVETFPMDPLEPDNLLYANGSFIPAKRLSDEAVSDIKLQMGDSFQEGGCFGYGPGIMILFQFVIYVLSQRSNQ